MPVGYTHLPKGRSSLEDDVMKRLVAHLELVLYEFCEEHERSRRLETLHHLIRDARGHVMTASSMMVFISMIERALFTRCEGDEQRHRLEELEETKEWIKKTF